MGTRGGLSNTGWNHAEATVFCPIHPFTPPQFPTAKTATRNDNKNVCLFAFYSLMGIVRNIGFISDYMPNFKLLF
jgi:hypothetical protein